MLRSRSNPLDLNLISIKNETKKHSSFVLDQSVRCTFIDQDFRFAGHQLQAIGKVQVFSNELERATPLAVGEQAASWKSLQNVVQVLDDVILIGRVHKVDDVAVQLQVVDQLRRHTAEASVLRADDKALGALSDVHLDHAVKGVCDVQEVGAVGVEAEAQRTAAPFVRLLLCVCFAASSEGTKRIAKQN